MKMNKNNLMKVLIVSILFAIFILPLISAPPGSSELGGIKPVDGTINLESESGKITVTNEFNTIKTAGGTIPNVESGNLVVENGNPVSGKLFFAADSSFDLNGQSITVPKDGSIEFKDGKIIISKDTSIEVEDTKIQAGIGGTEIKIQGNIIEAKGNIFVDYGSSPSKITLVGKDSSVEIQTDEDEKFEFKNSDSENLIVNIGSFHDSESEECKGKNCISYQNMGVGVSGEEWNKIKIDGDAIITKYCEEEQIYTINFEDGKAKLSRDLSKLENTKFDQKTVINYNKGDITLFIEKEGKDKITAGNGEFTNVDIVTQIVTTEPPKIPTSKKTTEPPGTDSKLKEKARGVYIDDKTLYSIVKEKGENIMSEDLILAWINQESSMNQNVKLGGCVGFTQVSAISFRDVINRNPEKYKEYLSYTNEELTKAIEDDALLNLEVGFDYMNSLKTTYGFSQEKVESNYKYTGNEEDICLMAYNAGPTVTKDILTEFKNTGGGDWSKLKDFLHTQDALNIFKKYKNSYGIKDTDPEDKVNSKLKWKINVVIKYIENIKDNANQ